ncbi:MAG: hypothetical protein JNK27_16380 [Chitinophagaceae bacterium]|nr:hypothetical protein [Chitinophagaceae bacterium]
MKALLISLNLFLALACAGQEPFAYFKVNISSFQEKAERVLNQYRFSSIFFFDNDIFYDKRDDSKEDFFINNNDSLNLYLNIHPFPLSGDRVATIEAGSVYGIRITKKSNSEEMRIFFRACKHIRFGEEISIGNLKFSKGIFFYDMLASGEKYKVACGNEINLTDTAKHRIRFKKLRFITSKLKEDLNTK